MNNRRILKNIGVSMVMKPISMILSFVYTPLALSYLGETKYGIWVIILNIVSWINYFDIGIGNGLRNKLTEAITLDDEEQAQKYVSTAYLGTACISFCFFIIVTLVWHVLGLTDYFRLTVDDENTNATIIISVLFVSINFILSLSKTSAYAIQQPGIISVVGVFGQLLQIVIILVVSSIVKQNLMITAAMYGIITLLDSIIIYYVVTRKKSYLRPKLALANKQYMKSLLSLGAGFFVLQICSLVLNTTDNLLISHLYGSADVTPYNIVYKVFSMIQQVHAILIMPMWSAYTEASTRKDLTWIKKTMKRINYISVLLSVAVVVGVFIFRPVARIWLQKELEYSNSLIIVFAVYIITQIFANNYSSFLCGVGHIKTSVIISAIGAVLNIPLSILFAEGLQLKLTGIIAGSLAVMSVSIIVLPIVTSKWMKNKAKEWGAY